MLDYIKIKNSINNNTSLWISVWVLLMLNLMMIFTIVKGFSLLSTVIYIALIIFGWLAINYIASLPSVSEENIEEEIKININELMDEIKPICEDTFEREVSKLTTPVIEELKIDTSKSVQWLWEDCNNILDKINSAIMNLNTTIQLVYHQKDERSKLIKALNINIDNCLKTIDELNKSRSKSFDNNNKFMVRKSEDFKTALQNERDNFFNHVYDLLASELEANDTDIAEYLNVYKLSERFQNIIIKSIDNNIQNFEKSIITEMEELVSTTIGYMQNSTVHLINNLSEIDKNLTKLINSCKNESNLIIKRLEESHLSLALVKQQANEILFTLAWQDILLEKRWDEIDKKLFTLKSEVFKKVDEDVFDYIEDYLLREYPFIYNFKTNRETILLYKSIIDTEVLYHIYKNKKLSPNSLDGVYVLFCFINPIEMLVNKLIVINNEGIIKKNNVRENIEKEEYIEKFKKIIEVLENKNISLYIENLYPHYFYNFCNNPFINQKQLDSNTAGWTLFLGILEKQEYDKKIYELIGMLLVMNIIRNKYMHPLKSKPLMIDSDEEIEIIRQCFFEIIQLLTSVQLKGSIKLNNKIL